MKILFSIITLLIITSTSLVSNTNNFQTHGWTNHITLNAIYKPEWSNKIPVKAFGKIKIYLPKKYFKSQERFPLIIGLPGWALMADEWRTKAFIEKFAEKHSFIVVLAEMGTTNYETRYYPETNPRFKWGEMPGGLWIGEVVIPFLRKHLRVDITGRKTGILGLSTGARGAVYNAQLYPNFFRAAAAISGDYDRKALYEWVVNNRKDLMRHEPPSVYMYGDPRNNPRILQRWYEVDNPSSAEKLKILKENKISILLIHGKKDMVCPPIFSETFYNLLKESNIDASIILADNMGHDWKLWASHLPQMIDYIVKKWNE